MAAVPIFLAGDEVLIEWPTGTCWVRVARIRFIDYGAVAVEGLTTLGRWVLADARLIRNVRREHDKALRAVWVSTLSRYRMGETAPPG